MTIRRIRITRLLKLAPLLLCFVALSWIGFYLLGPTTQPYEDEILEYHVAPNYVDYKSLLPAPIKDIEQRLSTAKKTLIIVSHGRSGSSILGDIFNHHPSVFYMYEPLQTVERIYQSFSALGINMSYRGLADEWLGGLLRCKFDNPRFLEDIEIYYRKQKHPRVSQAIASPPLCPYKPTDPRWDPALCPPMTSESLGSACKNNYNLTVLKILISRIPKNTIEPILTACSPVDVDCKIVFLMRDPRAMIPSSQSFGFFNARGDSARRGIRLYSYWRCKETDESLEIIRNLPNSFRKRIKIQRYEDLAYDPLKALSGLYEFAGLSVLESVRTWLNETTKQTRADCKKMNEEQATCTKDDAWAAANRWRWLVHPHEIDIIEHYCRDVMRWMGYKPVERSYDLLANKEILLFSDSYEAESWFSYTNDKRHREKEHIKYHNNNVEYLYRTS